MKVYYDKDADLSLIKGKKVTILGYGSQGHAHALNLHDSGMKVTVGLRKGGASWDKAKKAGLKVAEVADAVKSADIVMMLLPDEHIAAVYNDRRRAEPQEGRRARLRARLQRALRPGARRARTSTSGWSRPRRPATRCARPTSRAAARRCLVAVYQNPSKKARDMAISYASAIGGGKAGIIETNFKEETETDLFGEQAVLCGGCVELVKAGFDTLVEAGYAPEMAYFECLHELKLIVDLMYEGGIGTMNYSISNNAEYGEYVSGPKVIDAGTRQRMKEILGRIQSGEYAKEFVLENRAGAPTLLSRRRHDRRACRSRRSAGGCAK